MAGFALRYLNILFAIIVFNSCSAQINTSDPGISKNISESKKNNFFVKQYSDSTNRSDIPVQEVWVEKIWFNEMKNGKVHKVARRGCHLCFSIKQTPGLKFSVRNTNEWEMKHLATNQSVGTGYGMYFLDFDTCNLPDKIVIDLSYEKGKDTFAPGKPAGKLIFVAK